MELFRQGFAREQFCPVGRNADVAFLQIEQPDCFVVPAGAENQTDGRLFSDRSFILSQPGKIELHLHLVGWGERIEFELKRDQPFQFAVVEK